MRKAIARKKAKALIEKTTWLYHVCVFGECHIDRALVDAVQGNADDQMNVCTAIAQVGKRLADKMISDGCDFGQTEYLLPDATWHVLLIDGKLYVSSREFYPYPR